jgi:hypothetical protein
MSTIREQIIAAITTKLADIIIANGYATGIGARVERVRPVFQPAELPAISVIPQPETIERVCGKVVCSMPIIIEGFCLHEDINPSIVAEKMLGDLISCLTGIEKTLTFTSGGTHVIVPGELIVGATSSVTARVIAVTLTSGLWAEGTAAGTLRVRLQTGAFVSEKLKIGTDSDVATVAGNSVTIAPLGGVVEDIFYTGGGAEAYPDSGQDVTGCSVTFMVKYCTVLGNPSAQ